MAHQQPLTPTRTPAAAPPIPDQAAVLGIPLALIDYERTLDWIDAAVAADHRGYLCVAATHTVMASQEDPGLRAAVLGATSRCRTASRSSGRSTFSAIGSPRACTGPP